MKKRNIELLNLKNLTKKQEKKKKQLIDYKWIITVTLLAFFMSLVFSFISEVALPNLPLVLSIILVLLFIFLGILFDMIGVSVTSSDIEAFNSMSSRKVRGAKTAVKLMKQADKVSSFCNDVIGDICGIISGSAGALIAASISTTFSINAIIVALFITAITAALTIGGKALGKTYAINKGNIILYRVSCMISYFVKE
jgi:CBS domain containing-hemolysin-like protein